MRVGGVGGQFLRTRLEKKSRLKNTWERSLKYSSFVASRCARCSRVRPPAELQPHAVRAPPSPPVQATNNPHALRFPSWLQALTLCRVSLK